MKIPARTVRRGPLTLPVRAMPIPALAALVLAALVLALAGLTCCASVDAQASTSTSTSNDDHACVIPNGAHPTIAWKRLQNPILSYPGAGVKDEALIWADNRWHILFSEVTVDRSDPGGVRWNIATATSPNLVTWTKPDPWPKQTGVIGVASPDIVRMPSGIFAVTYQSNASANPDAQDHLFYRTSADLVHWSPAHPLAPGLASKPSDRQIDAAVAFTNHGAILGYKSGLGSTTTPQIFTIAQSPSGSLAGPWHTVGHPNISLYHDTVENYEFVNVASHWDLIATSNTLDQPWIFRLLGNPSTPSGWLDWSAGRELTVPSQSWNTGPGISSIGFEHANSAFLCVVPGASGNTDYLLYAGSTTLSAFGGWGDARIGIARSTDLVHWQVPPTRPPPTG